MTAPLPAPGSRGSVLLRVAAARFGTAPFALAALAVAAWEARPAEFGLRGYEDAHPDPARVAARLAGAVGLVARGAVLALGDGVYQLTALGLAGAGGAPPREPPADPWVAACALPPLFWRGAVPARPRRPRTARPQRVTVGGVDRPVREWAALLGLGVSGLYQRAARLGSWEAAVTAGGRLELARAVAGARAGPRARGRHARRRGACRHQHCHPRTRQCYACGVVVPAAATSDG